MALEDGRYVRALNPAERMVRVADEAYTMGFTTFARVRGHAPTGAVRRALDALASRHPLLSARVEGSRLRIGEARPIDLCEIGASRASTLERLEGELRHRRWPDDGPRARCTVLRHGADESTIALTFDHLVSDGGSGVIALRDLLRGIGEPDVTLEPIPSPGQNAFFPPGRGGARDLLGALRRAREMDRKPRPLRLGSKRDVPPEQRHARVRWVRLSREQTTALARAAREAGATVHGAVVAACLLGIADVVGEKGARTMRVLHPVDFRRYLPTVSAPRAIGDAVGYYVSSVDTDHSVSKNTPSTALAAEITRGVREEKAAGVPFLTAPTGGGLLVVARALLGAEAFRQTAERSLPGTMSVTNLGPLERLGLATRVGELTVEEVGFHASPSMFGAYAASVCTFDGSLLLALHHIEPLVDAARARSIGDAISARLGEFATPSADVTRAAMP